MHLFTEFNELADTRFGKMIVNVNDIYIGRSLKAYGEFSYGEVELFEQVVREGSIVVEAGANVGAHTLFLARKVGPTGFVFAMEPQRIVFQTLCGNLALNSITNVAALHVAVGSAAGRIIVPRLDYATANNFGGLGLGRYEQGEAVGVITIDSLGLDRCHLIKADVEGMEEEVLRGAEQTIARCRPILYVESDRDEKRPSLVRYIDSLGYAMYWHLPPVYNPNNHNQQAQNLFPGIVSRNILCVSRSVNQRIEGLARVEVP